MMVTVRRAVWLAVALVVACGPARADDESEAREAIRSLIDDLMKSDTSRELALRDTIQKYKDAGRLWVEETVSHPQRREEHGEFATGLLYIFSERRDDLVAPVRGLLKSPSEDAAVYGVKLITDLELGPKLAEELLGLFDRKDKAVLWIRNGAFKGVTDAKIIERLVAEAGKTGDRAEVAVGALADIETPEAHAFLRSVAVSETETAVRRDWALQGLAPFLDAEDERVAREGLASGDEELATAAFLAFCNSRKAPPPDVLRKARPKISDQMADNVDEMLALGGDEEAVTELLKRARGEEAAGSRRQLYERAARSTMPSSVAKFAKALKAEIEPYTREPLLVALGNSDSPVARDAIASCLSSRDNAETAVKALASIIRRGKAERAPTIELILAEKAEDQLETFCEELLGPTPAPREKLDLEACLVAVLERNAHNEQSRESLTRALYTLSTMEFGSSRAAVRKWRAWLDEEYRKIRPQ